MYLLAMLTSWLNHQVGFALGAFDRVEFDSLDFIRVKGCSHLYL
jgi:hypothetical protein